MMPKNAKLIAFFLVLLIAGIGVWNYQQKSKVKQLSSFEECAQAGYPIMESYPEQCRTPDGKSFTRQIPSQVDLQSETVGEIGLSFQHPSELVYRKEIANNGNTFRTAGFFLTKGSEQNPEYQLYGLYENYRDATEADLERAKTEMDPASIKETIIDGHQGIEGLITGPKTRYIMVVLKGNKLFSVSTIPPTKENKALTQQIISTFNFE